MENSENKSIIPTGTSNLAKTEKLLSITQKILSEIKPQYESVRIGNQEWMTRNLDVDRFRNGDLITHVASAEDWKKVGENNQPAWCYYDNDPENGKKYGKLYNWYAVNEPRGLAPKGFHVPTDEEWTILEEFLGEIIAGHKMKLDNGWDELEDEDREFQNGNGDNSSGFNALRGGSRIYDGRFSNITSNAFFWSATENCSSFAWYRNLCGNIGNVFKSTNPKQNGFSVRCLRDNYLSI
jgi:uncharacterized protein (TIGR02145 family)